MWLWPAACWQYCTLHKFLSVGCCNHAAASLLFASQRTHVDDVLNCQSQRFTPSLQMGRFDEAAAFSAEQGGAVDNSNITRDTGYLHLGRPGEPAVHPHTPSPANKIAVPRETSTVVSDRNAVPRETSTVVSDRTAVPRETSTVISDKTTVPGATSTVVSDTAMPQVCSGSALRHPPVDAPQWVR